MHGRHAKRWYIPGRKRNPINTVKNLKATGDYIPSQTLIRAAVENTRRRYSSTAVLLRHHSIFRFVAEWHQSLQSRAALQHERIVRSLVLDQRTTALCRIVECVYRALACIGLASYRGTFTTETWCRQSNQRRAHKTIAHQLAPPAMLVMERWTSRGHAQSMSANEKILPLGIAAHTHPTRSQRCVTVKQSLQCRRYKKTVTYYPPEEHVGSA